MADITYYRKKDSTMEEFFDRLKKYIPLDYIDIEKGQIQSHTRGGGVSVFYWDDETASHFRFGSDHRELVARLVQGEESGWQKITVENHGASIEALALFDYVNKLIASEFGSICESDINFPPIEEDEGDVDFDNLPPEVIALDPYNPIRAWILYNLTPEEREETLRISAEIERQQEEQRERYAKLAQKQEKKRQQDYLHPKRRRVARHR